MHLADAFIQSDLHCIQVRVYTFLSALAFPGNRTHDFGVASAMLYYLSYRKYYCAEVEVLRSAFPPYIIVIIFICLENRHVLYCHHIYSCNYSCKRLLNRENMEVFGGF